MSKRNYNDNEDFREDWGKVSRERKDRPGKKHNNSQHQEWENAPAKKNTQQKPKQTFRRHSDSEED